MRLFATQILCCAFFCAQAQTPFDVRLEPISIAGLGGIQSYAYGQHNGKWLLVGGRLDGLHRRQPFAAFDTAGNNTHLTVVDPLAGKVWTAPLASLPAGIREQLGATNFAFRQENNQLYCLGGYGFIATAGDHTTFGALTAIDVPATIAAIVKGQEIAPFFRQVADSLFAVTGGHLKKINSTFYLVGGHQFLGRYNPMGPNRGPGFVQRYTYGIRPFTLTDDGKTISIRHLPARLDEAHFRRRDFNVVPQILPNGEPGLTAFSGVFRAAGNIPYLTCIEIDSAGFHVNDGFSQYYNHYHCANIPLHSAKTGDMHTVFFGGIAQYYDSLGLMVQNSDVPFVRTIARVSRNSAGEMAEYLLPTSMPALLGAGSEFIPLETLPTYANGVIQLDALTADSTLVGYIYGGISSTAANIFWINDGIQSSASAQVFKVWLKKGSATGKHALNVQSNGDLRLQAYPRLAESTLTLDFHLSTAATVKVHIATEEGVEIAHKTLKDLHVGENTWHKKIKKLAQGQTYRITLETPFEKVTQTVIVVP